MGLRILLFCLGLPLLVSCQQFKANYACDFENSDCGFHAHPDTGAYFARGSVNVGARKTQALVLGDLPRSTGNWSKTRPRVASAWSPFIFPGSLFGKLSVSLDYFLTNGDCVEFLQLGQTVDNGTRILGRTHTQSEWKTIKATIEKTDQPVKLVVEAHLQASCYDRERCSCSGSAVVDNLRISSSENQAPALENLVEFDGENHPTDPEMALAAMDIAFQELRNHNRRAVEQPEDVGTLISHPTYHGEKSIPTVRPRICPPAPSCRPRFIFPDTCPATTVRQCVYISRPNWCNCQYRSTCAEYRCPVILPCPPDPPCPTYTPVDPKSWDPKTWRHGQAPLVE